ncbi:MAG: hypothetical protein ACFE9R_09435 [Candidatus Hermodarchaeota archaeon]
MRNSKLKSEKETQNQEDFCACGCVDQINEIKQENPLFSKKVNRRNSCC